MATLSYSNLWSFEASVSAAVTVSAPWNSRKIAITNDSSLTPVSISFHTTSTSKITLLPTESLSLEFVTNKFVINTVAAAGAAGIRVWMWG